LLLCARRAGDIDRLLHDRRSAAPTGSAPRLQLTQEAEHRLVKRLRAGTTAFLKRLCRIDAVGQSCNFIVAQVIKSLRDPLEEGDNLTGIYDNVRKRGLGRNGIRRRRKVDRDGAEIVISASVFSAILDLAKTVSKNVGRQQGK